jgi:hypothetical protein
MLRTSFKLISAGLLAVTVSTIAAAQAPAAAAKAALPPAAIGSLSDFFRGSPGTSGGSPVAFGPAMGDIWVGGAYVNEIRRAYIAKNTFAAGALHDDGLAAFGFGLGDATEGLGLSTVITSYSPYRLGLGDHTTVSAQIFRHVNETMSIAIGGENALTAGGDKENGSYYGVLSKIFWNPISGQQAWLQSITVSGGVGNGRFRTIEQIRKGEETVGVFASVGLLFHEQVSMISDWTGQDLNIGVTVVPFKKFPLALTPTLTEVLGIANSSARFLISAGIGYHF